MNLTLGMQGAQLQKDLLSDDKNPMKPDVMIDLINPSEKPNAF